MLGAGVDAVLPILRSQAESTMKDSCTIERESSAWDESLQKTVTSWVVVHDGVPCALTDSQAGGRELVSDVAASALSPLVKVPVAFDGIEPDDRVTLASGPVVWVTDAPVRTQQVVRRLECRWVK